MPTWLIIVIAVLALMAVGGYFARVRQLERTRPAFESRLARADHDLAEAAAQDRGWDRELLETAARRASLDRLGVDPDELHLVEVIDEPGTENDRAVFEVHAGADRHRVVLGRRRDGDWIDAP